MQNEVITFKTVFFGVIAPTAGVVASNLDKIEQWMRIASLAIGLAVGVFTLFVSVTNWNRRRRAERRTNSTGPNVTPLAVIGLMLSLGFGCSVGPAPQKGGKMKSKLGGSAFSPIPEHSTKSDNGDTLETIQPENPAGPATQSQTTTEETKIVLPAKTEVVERRITPSEKPGLPPTTNETRFVLSEPTPMTRSVIKEASATVGGAQKDEARTLGVKQAAMRPVMAAGVALIVAALALAYFKNFLAAGIAGLGGVAMLVLFVTLPQYGLQIMGVGLGVTIAAVLLAFYAYHKGKDENKNGIPDALERINSKLSTTTTQPK